MQCVHGPCCLVLPCSLYIPSPLVLYTFLMCYLQVKHPPRDWRTLGKCQKVIQHRPKGGVYPRVAMNSEGLLAVTDDTNRCVHLLSKDGALVRSIGGGVFSGNLCGVAFDLKGNVWVADRDSNKVMKLSQDGRLLRRMLTASDVSDRFRSPIAVLVIPEGVIYICDCYNHRVTVHDKEVRFLFTFGSKGSGSGCFDEPGDITFGSDGLVYVADYWNKRVCVWSKEGTFRRDFKTKYAPTSIAATSDNHLLITSSSFWSSNVMVYTLEGKLVHEFGKKGSAPGRFDTPGGTCIDDDGLVYVADEGKKCVQVF